MSSRNKALPGRGLGMSRESSPATWGVNDAKNMVGFADGHVSYVNIYWKADLVTRTFNYDPPAGYDYKWSGH